MSVPSLAGLLDLPGMPAAAEQARSRTDALLRHRILRRRSAQVSAESLLRAAWASASLSGYDGAWADVRADADPRLHGALRAHEALGSLAGTWRLAPAQALARLHLLAAPAGADPDRVGRPVAGERIASRLDGVRRLVVADTGVPAVLEAAVVHAEILSLRAFGAESGIVARAAARLVMIVRGLDPRALTVPEVGHREDVAEYAAALSAYAGGGADGVARWLRHCCAAAERGAQEGLAICESVARG
ncbi:MAG: oxidoreductase [Mycobacteriales bacterium]